MTILSHLSPIYIAPLTDIQKGMIFEITRFKDRNYYINQETLIFKSHVDAPLLHKAFLILFRKYEVLRSAIVRNDYGPSLAIYDNIDSPYDYRDYSNHSCGIKEEKYNKFLKEDFAKPIDIYYPPLIRLTAFKFHENEYRVVLDIHHLIADGLSIHKIMCEWLTTYFSFFSLLSRANLPVGEVVKYKNDIFIKFNDEETQKAQKAQKYWRNILDDFSEVAVLPCVYSERKHPYRKETRTIVLDGSLRNSFVSFVNSNSLTINSLLQAAWGIFLFHYSNNENVAFGAVRAYPKDFVQNDVGVFVNTLPMKLCISPQENLLQYLHSVREQSKKLREYVTVPLNQIYEWCAIPLNVPLFQTIINYEPFSLRKSLQSTFSELCCEFSSRIDTPYPLVLEVIDDGEMLQLELHYDVSMFDGDYVESILFHYRDLLIELISNPNRKITDLPILKDDVFKKIIYDWNNTHVDYPLYKTVHELFEEQVEKNPLKVVLVHNDKHLTYSEFNKRANQLANYLIQNGTNLEDCIAICLKTSFEMLISILAVLKAGCAYMPIDVNYPSERIKYLFQDSKPKIIITDSEFLNKLNEVVSEISLKAVIVNLDKIKMEHLNSSNPKLSMKSSNLMYLIYTSGSTGQPKGSMIEHHSAVNLTLSCLKRLSVTQESRILQIASFSFDVSVVEWCMALLSGATLYLFDKDYFSPQAMLRTLEKYKITLIILAHSILSALPPADLPYLKTIASGGEPLSRRVLELWSRGRDLINVYGITETTVCTTMQNCSTEQELITVGKPLANSQIYILNKYLQPLPFGVTGEIYVGGDGICRGYVNNQMLTDEKFIYVPFLKGRLYRTGDLGRFTVNGELEFLGRVDEQVKVRGFRIEMHEIECAINKHPLIEKSVVFTKKVDDYQQIVAFVVPIMSKNSLNIDSSQLREFLRNYLPVYMIPAQISVIQEIPLNSNGKIDKQKLLNINIISSVSSINVLCKTTEKLLLVIQQLLCKFHIVRPELSIDKNFLDIGLDSLMLVELAMKLSSEFGRQIDITDLFTYTTIESLAGYIESLEKFSKLSKFSHDYNQFDMIKKSIQKRKSHLG